ncbi:MAG: FKBP-type peptidyl-prolyl cis-trans isomerase [Bacteroidales bacterium]
MKTLKTIFLCAAVAVLALSSCKGTYQKGDHAPDITSSQIDTLSYSLGVILGNNIKGSDFGEINMTKLDEGMWDALDSKEQKVTPQEINTFLQKYMELRKNYIGEKNKKEGEDFLVQNKTKDGVVTIKSGLQYQIVKEGEGISPSEKDTVEVEYRGTFVNGDLFDSTEKTGKPAKFPLKYMVKGFKEGMQYCKEGGEINLYIPFNLAYGTAARGPIPAYSCINFNVKLIKVYKYDEKNGKDIQAKSKRNRK